MAIKAVMNSKFYSKTSLKREAIGNLGSTVHTMVKYSKIETGMSLATAHQHDTYLI